jgi:hypothetical protein
MIDYYFGQFLINYLNKSIKDITNNTDQNNNNTDQNNNNTDQNNNNTDQNNEPMDLAVGLVATKCTFWLPLVIKNILHKIKNCKLYFFGSNESVYFIKELINYDNISYHIINDFNTIKEYNKLLLNPHFWEIFKEKNILITQPDCIILRDVKLTDLQFDYIGALCGAFDDNFIINGGLSLRNKNTMITICNHLTDEDKNGNTAEDIIFTRVIKNNERYKYPSINDCYHFSIESIGCIDTVLGIHGTDKLNYIHPSIKKEFIKKYL